MKPETQYEFRKQVVRLRRNGKSNQEIAETFGICHTHMSTTWQMYQKDGHHSKDVKAWLEKQREQIELFYLPSYSPELSPDEYLNGNLKQKVRSGIPARSQKEKIRKTRSFMKNTQRRPHHVRGYFKHPKVAYAA